VSAARRAFGLVNANVMRSPSISANAKALYALLATYADEDGACWPSNATLMKNMDWSESTVQRTLRELQDKGALIREERTRENGSQASSTSILVDVTTVKGGSRDDTPRGSRDDTPRGSRDDTPKKNNTNYEQTTLPSTKVEEHVQSTETFDQFWALYPKKADKIYARKIWDKVTKTIDPECVLAGLRLQQAALVDAKTRGFCKDPATWLNKGSWEDEITARQVVDRDAPRQPGESRDQWLIRAGYAG